MEEMKKLTIPEGYEFDRVKDGEVILKKKEVVLPKSYYDCMEIDSLFQTYKLFVDVVYLLKCKKCGKLKRKMV